MPNNNLETMAALTSLEKKFTASMASFEYRMSVTPPSSTTMEQLASEFAIFKLCMLEAIELLRGQLTAFSIQLDDIDNSGRKKFLCLLGVDEADDEDLCTRVTDVVKQKLKLESFTAADIKSCYRLGKPSKNQTRPRPILVRYHNISVRSQVWQSKKPLKGSGITVTEFLTPRRRELFLEARRRHGIHKCCSLDGVVYVKLPDGNKIRLDTLQQLDQLDQTATEAAAAESPKTVPPAPAASKAH